MSAVQTSLEDALSVSAYQYTGIATLHRTYLQKMKVVEGLLAIDVSTDKGNPCQW